MISNVSYAEFLDRARSSLAAQGGQMLDSGISVETFWDDVVLLNVPGAPALYAFAKLPADGSAPQRMMDELAKSLAERGLFAGVSVSLVYVFVGSSVEPGMRNATVKLAPKAFYQGLRPQVWIVDVSSRKLYASRSLRRPEGYDAVLSAAMGESTDLTQSGSAGGTQRIQQFQAFYGMMQMEQPIVTYALIAINVCVFLVELSTNALSSDSTLTSMGMEVPRLVQQGEWWRLVTTMFLHGSFQHILFNMASLLAVGSLAERLYGRVRFIVIYFGSGVVASLVSVVFWLMSNQANQGALGASGAIFGVAGALVVVRFQRSTLIPGSVRRRITTSVTPLIFVSLGLSALIPHVDNSAHVGGLVSGGCIALVVGMRSRLAGVEPTIGGTGGQSNSAAVEGRSV